MRPLPPPPPTVRRSPVIVEDPMWGDLRCRSCDGSIFADQKIVRAHWWTFLVWKRRYRHEVCP